MLRFSAVATFGLSLVGSSAALAEDCSPHCDYRHNYGPYDLSYISTIQFAISEATAPRTSSTPIRVIEAGGSLLPSGLYQSRREMPTKALDRNAGERRSTDEGNRVMSQHGGTLRASANQPYGTISHVASPAGD
jgi:hypothetical protein